MTLKQARRMSDITQLEVAEKLGVHVQTYREIEKNPENATVKQAKILSEIFNVSYDDIFFSSDSTLSRTTI